MTRYFEPMTGREAGHVTTWDFQIFLLKWGYLIAKFMVFFNPRTSRSYTTAHIPAELALSLILISWIVTSRPATLAKFSWAVYLVAISACPADKFKLKAVSKLKHSTRLHNHVFFPILSIYLNSSRLFLKNKLW